MPNFYCEFLEPINLGDEINPDFEYSKLNCTNTNLEIIQNEETGAEFYLEKNINYGDALILFFLILFAIFGTIKIIADFFIPKKMDFKK